MKKEIIIKQADGVVRLVAPKGYVLTDKKEGVDKCIFGSEIILPINADTSVYHLILEEEAKAKTEEKKAKEIAKQEEYKAAKRNEVKQTHSSFMNLFNRKEGAK